MTLRLRSPLLAAGLLAVACPMTSPAQSPAAPASTPLGSRVFRWEDLTARPTPVGARRDVADQPTATLATFESHVSTLLPGRASHAPHTHPQEEVIILRDGTLDVFVNGTTRRVGPGSLFFFAANDPHAVQNPGPEPATYVVLNFATALTATLRDGPPTAARPVAGQLGSTVFPWDELPLVPTAKGGRRAVVDRPTATLRNFECHVTTLGPGLDAHAAHRHPDEEIILVREGTLTATINGEPHVAGAGALCFFASHDLHGLRNPGPSPATYYVIRVVTAATPPPAP